MTDRDLDQALDELYGVDASEFIARRKSLAAGLRAEGDKVAARQLLAARRPSTSAWALNQLARQRPELIEQLLERSRVLLDAQTRAIAGKRESMRDATSAHRATLEEATAAALAILGPRANEGFRSEIGATLRAASTDAAVGRTLQLGRLVREASSTGGFPDTTELTVSALPVRPQRSRRTAEPADATDPDVSPEVLAFPTAQRAAQLQAELAAQAEAERREAEHRAAKVAAAEAAAEVARAEERVAQLEHDVRAARQDLRDARARNLAAQAEARDR